MVQCVATAMATNKDRLCSAGAQLSHMNGFPSGMYPFPFPSSMRGSPPFEVLTNGGYFRSFPNDLPKEMASLWRDDSAGGIKYLE